MDYENWDADEAGSARPDRADTPSPDVGNDSNLIGANYLVGSAVRNHEGENLGEVIEVMLDAPSGQVSYAVLSFGGVLGMRAKLFAVPWSALTFDSKKRLVVLQVKKGSLKHTPGFDKDKWPRVLDDSLWWQQIQFYYR
jgi:sporulation protein YlmC with PRC-barrel domain